MARCLPVLLVRLLQALPALGLAMLLVVLVQALLALGLGVLLFAADKGEGKEEKEARKRAEKEEKAARKRAEKEGKEARKRAEKEEKAARKRAEKEEKEEKAARQRAEKEAERRVREHARRIWQRAMEETAKQAQEEAKQTMWRERLQRDQAPSVPDTVDEAWQQLAWAKESLTELKAEGLHPGHERVAYCIRLIAVAEMYLVVHGQMAVAEMTAKTRVCRHYAHLVGFQVEPPVSPPTSPLWPL